MKKQTIKKWFDEHTKCGFEKIPSIRFKGNEIVQKEYYDGTYMLCKTKDSVFLENGTDSLIYPIEDLSGFGEFFEKEVKEKLSIR